MIADEEEDVQQMEDLQQEKDKIYSVATPSMTASACFSGLFNLTKESEALCSIVVNDPEGHGLYLSIRDRINKCAQKLKILIEMKKGNDQLRAEVEGLLVKVNTINASRAMTIATTKRR